MGLFKSYEREPKESAKPAEPVKKAAPATEAVSEPEATSTAPAKKQVPTPSRKAAEAARRERMRPSMTPSEMRLKERQDRQKERAEAFERIEKSPGRVLLRDWVDSRRSISAWTMPILMVLLALQLTIGSGTQNPTLVMVMSYAVWAFLLFLILDIFLMWRGFKKLAAERIPNEPLKGLMTYGISRSINIKRFRQPKPRVKSGEQI
ncbi:MAG: DUF3043 domain-containing protein [Propionibacteriaceae bacterium]|nr:DUF3043 domain-containing protein [Propionibacteriaceae bacterium]